MRLPAYSASAKVICFIEKLGDWCPGILPNQEVFFRISLECKGTIVKFYVKVVSLATCHLPSVIGHDPT
ncbi:hypothetical protein BKM09_008120 [Pseudomonas amygdali pv. morsprunorum]|nr:hypothetical protein BKM09_008120 [Pseudomonas amygdali pv. morsprunorum]